MTEESHASMDARRRPSHYATATATADDSLVRRLWLSQHILPALTVSIELKLFDALENGKSTVQLASAVGCGTHTLLALLNVLRGLGLVQGDPEDTWWLSATGRAYAVTASPTFCGPYLCSTATNAAAHERLLSRLRRGCSGPQTETERAWTRGSFDGDSHRAEACVVQCVLRRIDR